MKKNLKKVISAVIALALSVGSVAMAAPSFSDVADTASYADAVNTLSALGVIAGYEDGTFKPDNNITRAEVSTMVVAALNRSADAEGAKGTTKFADVNTDAKAWASGFVNIGVSEGFISGYEDGTFKPDNNVTFAEIVSMLVRVAGYGRYAEYLGGWPNGYLSVGSDKGITKGVSAGANVPVTRAQVAQMIYNSLIDVPTVESTTLTTDSNGNLVPEMTIMDGKNDNDYKTLLTEKFDAYYVEGHVSATNRTNSARFDPDEVEFTIEYTENYDDSDVVIKKGGTPVPEKVYVGETDAANYLFTYASAIIQIDEDDDATIIKFTPSGKNTTESFDASLIDDDDYNNDDTVFSGATTVNEKPYVRYYATKDASKSTKYNLDKKFRLFVNGVEVDVTKANFEKYVVNNTVGTVDYIDRYTSASKADGYYDLVFVTYYATAKVDAVNTTSGKITFATAYNNGGQNSITLDPEDDDIVYEISYNGEEMTLAGLQTDDIISIAFDVEAGLDDSNFYEIFVSRDTADGKFTSKNPDDEEVTIGGKNYEFVMGYGEADNLNMSDEYTLYLDAFGRIFDYETAVSSAKLAVIDRYTKSNSDDYFRAQLYTTDGAARNLEVDTSKVNLTDDEIKAKVYKNGESGAKKDLEGRVVEYKVNSSTGRVTYLKFMDAKTVTANYKANSKSLGSVKISDSTKVIDAVDYVTISKTSTIPTYSDFVLSSVSKLADDAEYTASAFGTKNSDGTYPLLIVTSAGGVYTFETSFAVLTAAPKEGIDDATTDDIYTLDVLYNGEKLEGADALVVNDDADVFDANGGAIDITDLVKGDVIVFNTDNKGNIKTINVLISASDIGIKTSYAQVAANAFVKTANLKVPADSNNWTGYWKSTEDTTIDQGKEVTQLVYGAIVDKKSNYFTLGSFGISNATAENVYGYQSKAAAPDVIYGSVAGKLFTDKTLEAAVGNGGVYDIDLNDATKVYVFDYSKTNAKAQLYAGTRGDITASAIPSSLLYNSGDYIPWDNAGVKDGANFAFAKVVDGTATDVFVILSK